MAVLSAHGDKRSKLKLRPKNAGHRLPMALATAALMASPRKSVSRILPAGSIRKIEGMPSTPYWAGKVASDQSPRNPWFQRMPSFLA